MKKFIQVLAFAALFFSLPCIVGGIVCCFQSTMESGDFWGWGLIITYPILFALSFSKIKKFFSPQG